MVPERSLRTVLVANRGEIARRVVAACRRAGLRSVAVHTDLDAPDGVLPLHAREADEAVRVPSYLDADAIVRAALETGADAVHPGYGFLSENADFARAVTAAGLVFVGPDADVIDLMGRKDRAREVAERAGVPVMPRYDLEAGVPADAYPVLVKAAAGGGGKGMHVVRDAADLDDAVARARREAASAFGDDTLLVEAYVEGGRHVEVQVFGDRHGHVVHLLDRDCSAQRRHQKVVEEAPAPDLDPDVRELLRASSVALCREVGYVGAGTVEFLVAAVPDTASTGAPGAGRQAVQRGFFLEMNTRLQVEHPVTEQVTGLDLVQLQLDVAAGRPLPITQDDVRADGHAVEVRVYAEDPYAGFLPQAGHVVDAHWPGGAPVSDVGTSVHAALVGEGTVTSSYDPMIAKLVAHGPDREAAIDAVLALVDASSVAGIASNLGWLRRLVDSREFRAGEVHTGWLDAYDGPLLERPGVPDAVLGAVAAALRPPAVGEGLDRADGFRVAGPAAPVRAHLVEADGTQHSVEPLGDPAVRLVRRGARAWATWRGQTWLLEPADAMRRAGAAAAGDADVTSPMPGTVVALDVAEGDEVTSGQRLGAVEAMKMELALVAPHAGTVTHVGAGVGAQVAMGQLLVHVEPEDGGQDGAPEPGGVPERAAP